MNSNLVELAAAAIVKAAQELPLNSSYDEYKFQQVVKAIIVAATEAN